MELTLTYNAPTAVVTRGDRATVRLAADSHRQVAFRGRVRDPLRLRQMLLAMQRCLAIDARAGGERDQGPLCDPIVTVHPDQIFLEALSNDGSAYVRLSAPIAAFDPDSVLRPGTANVQLNWELRKALLDLRSSRHTEVAIGSAGLSLDPAEHVPDDRFERALTVPPEWIKGFLQVQGALTMRPYLFDVRPTDMLSVIAFLDEHIPHKPPHGMRYVMQPDKPVAVVLEPWEERFELRGTHYAGYERTVRLWGRRRLALLADALPYADRLTVAVLGRGLPHVYICHAGLFSLLLAVSGWGTIDWASGGSFDLFAARAAANVEHVERVYDLVRARIATHADAAFAADAGLAQAEAEHALFALCRAGRVMYDLENQSYRLRELFATPINVADFFQPDARVEAAQRLIDDAKITSWKPVRSPGGRQESRIEAIINDNGSDYVATASVDDSGRLRFGHCECSFFQAYLMARGPCEHILAVRLLFDSVNTLLR